MRGSKYFVGSKAGVRFAVSALGTAVALALSGTALADDVVVAADARQDYEGDVLLGASETLNVNGTLNVAGTLKGQGSIITSNTTGSVTAKVFDWYGATTDRQDIGLDITAEQIIYRGINGNHTGRVFSGKLIADEFWILADSVNQTGILVTNNETFKDVGRIVVEAVNAKRTRLETQGENIAITAPVTLITHDSAPEDAAVEVLSGSTAFSSLTVQGWGKLQSSNAASLSIENLTVEDDAGASLQVWANNADSDAHFTLGKVVLGKNSTLAAACDSTNYPTIVVQGNLDITLGAGAEVDFAGKGHSKWYDSKVQIASTQMKFTVTDLENPGNVYLPKSGTDLEKTSLTVTSIPEANTGDAKEGLEKLANVVVLSTKNMEDVTFEYDAAEGVELVVTGNDISDGATATIGAEGRLENVVVQENANIHGLAETAALGLHIWRNEMNDVGKRLGDLRASRGMDNGAWARIYTGKASFGGRGIENKYTAVQAGYDRAVTPDLRLGAAFSYTDGNNDFALGGGDNSVTALTLYGSWFHEGGSFLDVSAKAGRLENEFEVILPSGRSKADYDANAWSFSIETGHRFTPSGSFFVEPQLELMYGRVESVDYTTSTGVAVRHDAADMLVGRAGFMLGLDCPQDRGNVYVRASVLHDWRGEADYTFTKGSSRSLSENLGGTWMEYGLGANFNVTNAVHVYADLEAADGGEVDTDYRFNLGVRYAF